MSDITLREALVRLDHEARHVLGALRGTDWAAVFPGLQRACADARRALDLDLQTLAAPPASEGGPAGWMRKAAHGPVYGPTAESVRSPREEESFRQPIPLYRSPAPPPEPEAGEGLSVAARALLESARVPLEDAPDDDATEVPIRLLRRLAAALPPGPGED